MSKFNIVRKSDNCYQVIKEGNKRASKVFDNEKDAVEFVKNKDKIEKKKKNNKGVIFLICLTGILIGIAIGFFSGKSYFNGLEFYLEGDKIISINLNSQYNEQGFVAKYNHKDISSYVKVTYENKSLDNIECHTIDTSVESEYIIKYHLEYNEYDEILERLVIVEYLPVVETDELQIHFLELGNNKTGDSIYIKAGDTDILVDAGSRQSSSKTICEYIDEYCTDGVLEYVIATHAHQDHIAGFVGTKKIPGIFEHYKCELIIDFPIQISNTALYESYAQLVENEVNDDGATHYTALECYNNINGASRTYEIADGITLSILYNYYYEVESNDENNHSVCFLINDGTNNYLFTGDLESDGEKKLVQYNDLPKCKLYKAGHHGSKTSSSNELLAVIEPEIICVCCCAGSDEYTVVDENMFPTQDFIDRVAKYTDKIFVTTIVSDNELGFESFNGTIIVSSNNGIVGVECSNNNTILRYTEWFLEHRKWPDNGV